MLIAVFIGFFGKYGGGGCSHGKPLFLKVLYIAGTEVVCVRIVSHILFSSVCVVRLMLFCLRK
jgi:hypothetical protein